MRIQKIDFTEGGDCVVHYELNGRLIEQRASATLERLTTGFRLDVLFFGRPETRTAREIAEDELYRDFGPASGLTPRAVSFEQGARELRNAVRAISPAELAERVRKGRDQ